MELLLGGFIVLPIWLLILQKWRRGLLLFLCYLPVSGVAIIWSNWAAPAVLLKDFVFVIPTYLAFFLTAKQSWHKEIPPLVLMLIVAHVSIIILQVLNPGTHSLLVSMIGLKVWLFYLPLVFLCFDYTDDYLEIVKIFRLLTVLLWVPCSIGIIQWFGCSILGYEATMAFFYGAGASAATQAFTQFEFGSGLYRIPSTFSFSAQYSSFLWAALLSAYILGSIETKQSWRKFAKLSFALVIFASFLSGARAAYVYIPLICATMFALHHGIKGTLKILFSMAAILAIVASVSGLELRLILQNVLYLSNYYLTEHAIPTVLEAMGQNPMGMGTGMNTIASKYAFNAGEHVDILKVENYYAKVVNELGIPGFIVFNLVQFTFIILSFKLSQTLKSAQLRGVCCALCAFFLAIAVGNVKTFRLDFDPLNSYYWIFVGLLLKINQVDRQLRTTLTPQPQPAEEQRLHAL